MKCFSLSIWFFLWFPFAFNLLEDRVFLLNDATGNSTFAWTKLVQNTKPVYKGIFLSIDNCSWFKEIHCYLIELYEHVHFKQENKYKNSIFPSKSKGLLCRLICYLYIIALSLLLWTVRYLLFCLPPICLMTASCYPHPDYRAPCLFLCS